MQDGGLRSTPQKLWDFLGQTFMQISALLSMEGLHGVH